ncbi:Hypothetical protein R9X50_00713300 [Acrodontium crateriforme]|uniref:Uncharacterized protein n=1 Tax=Acrodontium crateriforme TaxID=150365 RepID=A0AAQ3RAI0_9PEZI|nr:Hypothetical protein R9X50_00713300 [Acrodontium crateriforme]
MQRTLIRRAQYGLQSGGAGGVQPWRQRVGYKNFKSQYGPQYKIGRHIYGWNAKSLINAGFLAGGFGAAAGIFALFFFGGVPRVQRDILQKLPLIGGYFVHEIAPEDNPF